MNRQYKTGSKQTIRLDVYGLPRLVEAITDLGLDGTGLSLAWTLTQSSGTAIADGTVAAPNALAIEIASDAADGDMSLEVVAPSPVTLAWGVSTGYHISLTTTADYSRRVLRAETGATYTLHLQRPVVGDLSAGRNVYVWIEDLDITADELDGTFEGAILTVDFIDSLRTIYTHRELVDFVKVPLVNPALPAGFFEHWPGYELVQLQPLIGASNDMSEILKKAFGHVCDAITATGFRPYKIASSGQMEAVVYNRLALVCARSGIVPIRWADFVSEFVDIAQKAYTDSLSDLLQNIEWYDKDMSNTTDGTEETNLGIQWMRTTR